MQFITLDTVNVHGGASGSVEESQLAWLETQLRANSSTYLVPNKPPPPIRIPPSDVSGSVTIVPGRGLTDAAGSTVVKTTCVRSARRRSQ